MTKISRRDLPVEFHAASSIELSAAAQYLRMSTEHQRYSIPNQSTAIALYAAAHNMGIIRSFSDEGKSGTTIKWRKGLQELLRVVASGAADFKQVLVYDVSRWGRFPDSDEAAHYEFLCKQAGIAVHYCAEQFDNDNSTTSNLLKALKRVMAGEYSRELSVKICTAQRRLMAMGFWQGGQAPFGMLRQLVSESGERKQILKFGEWKSVTTDRVVLTPGPPEAVQTVRLAFDLYTKRRKSRREIANILNQRKRFWGRTPWTIAKLRYLLTNPVYRGAYVYGKHMYKRHMYKHVPREQWYTIEQAFTAIISERQWTKANEMIREDTKDLVDSEMLEGLRRLLKRKGRLSQDLINAARDVPSCEAYKNHFGGINEAYKAIGYPSPKKFSFVSPIRMQRKMRDVLYDRICERVRALGGTAERQPGPGVILINGGITVKVKFATGHVRPTGQKFWTLRLGKRPTNDILIIGRIEPPDPSVLDYYVVPAYSQIRGSVNVHRRSCAPFLEPYHFAALEPLIEAFGRCRIPESA